MFLRARKATTIEEVVEYQLCTGCGVCAFMEPGRFAMQDAYDHGRRPFVRRDAAASTGTAFRCCPGVALAHESGPEDAQLVPELREAWGPVYGVWEGAAVCDEVRFAGSSGGAATALALYCLEQGHAGAVLHTAARPDAPYLNQTVLSTSHTQLLAATGSRYAPASPCEALGQVETLPGKAAFVGKPCDVAAVRRARRMRPGLDERLGPIIAFFCAGTPSTRGTVELLARLGISDLGSVRSVRYRGNGWPGEFTAKIAAADGREVSHSLSYADSWGFVQKYRPWRCHVCPDHTGEFADVAVGDPWHRAVVKGEPGLSLIVARTRLGYDLVRAAAEAGYLRLERCDPSLLPRSQPDLLRGRGALWGRLATLRLFGAPTPRYAGFETFRVWCRQLRFREKIRSFSGTAKRIFTRRLRRRIRIASPGLGESHPSCKAG